MNKPQQKASSPLMTWPSLQGAFWCGLHPEQHLRRCDSVPPRAVTLSPNFRGNNEVGQMKQVGASQ